LTLSSRRKLTVLKNTEIVEALGQDALIIFSIIITIVPLFNKINLSPILGFLGMGVILGPTGLGLLRDINDLDTLGELGIMFLLFEQGLELTVPRVQALSKYAFGLGLQQVVFSTIAFAIFPFVGGIKLLENVFKLPDNLIGITRVDEAVVIGATLALSSSAFVLKTLQEKGKLSEKFAKASLGILLLQDIAIIPLLVLLPVIETQKINFAELGPQLQLLALGTAKSLLGVSAIVVIGRIALKKIYEVVAATRSNEAFVGLCLLVVAGTGTLTKELGLSESLGAFVAGLLLAESSYKSQVEADIQPFRGLFLALFFITTGASVDPLLLYQNWPTALSLLVGLLAFKTSIISILGPVWGLTFPESVRTGLLLSGGGEFAFVVLTLAERLDVIPSTLSKILVGVVVLSMALTPLLYSAGEAAEKFLTATRSDSNEIEALKKNEDYIVICGFGPMSEIVASYLSVPSISEKLQATIVAFSLSPTRVERGKQKGYKVTYGDGSNPAVLRANHVENPKAMIITNPKTDVSKSSILRLRAEFPKTPIFAIASEYADYWKLKDAGATDVWTTKGEVGIGLAVFCLDHFSLTCEATYSVEKGIRDAFTKKAIFDKKSLRMGKKKIEEAPSS